LEAQFPDIRIIGMKLFHVSQQIKTGCNTYTAMVVCAESEEEARNIHPAGSWNKRILFDCWCDSPNQAIVKYLGEAHSDIPKGIICSSYDAG
jgi:hypothetical protein